MLQVDSVARVLRLVSLKLQLRCYGVIIIWVGDVLETRIVTSSIIVCLLVILSFRFLFHLIGLLTLSELSILHVHSSLIRVFANDKLPLDVALDLGLLLLDWIFAQKSVCFHKKHVDLCGVENFWFLQRQNDLFVVSRLERGLVGAEAAVQKLEKLTLEFDDAKLLFKDLMELIWDFLVKVVVLSLANIWEGNYNLIDELLNAVVFLGLLKDTWDAGASYDLCSSLFLLVCSLYFGFFNLGLLEFRFILFENACEIQNILHLNIFHLLFTNEATDKSIEFSWQVLVALHDILCVFL